MAPIAMRCRAKCSCCHSRQRSTTPPSLPGKMKILHHSHASCPCRGPEVHLTFQWFYEALSQEYHSPFVCRRVSVLPCGTQVMPKPVGCHCQIHWAWPGHGTKCRQSGCPLCIAQCSHNYHLHIDQSKAHFTSWLVFEAFRSKGFSKCFPQWVQPTQGKPQRPLPVSIMTETLWGGVPTKSSAK